ncbi:MAG: hypothetical protein ABI369_02860 [Acetobacteraceae bacterium]
MPEPPRNPPPIPLSRLGELDGWYFAIRCGQCGRRATPKIADLAAAHGLSLPVWRLVARLRCRATTRGGGPCGAKPDLVTLVQGRERRKDFLVYREIILLDDRLRIGE